MSAPMTPEEWAREIADRLPVTEWGSKDEGVRLLAAALEQAYKEGVEANRAPSAEVERLMVLATRYSDERIAAQFRIEVLEKRLRDLCLALEPYMRADPSDVIGTEETKMYRQAQDGKDKR